MLTANEIELTANSQRYTMGKALVQRLLKIIEKSDKKDKVLLALNYAHSVTKVQMRGAK